MIPKRRPKMKLAVIAVLLAAVFIHDSEASSCYGKNVEVTVINGIGMTGDGLSRPDPYVKVTIGDVTKKTKVIRSTRHPVWWQSFSFSNVGSNEMKIEVWDQDSGFRGGDDHIGTCMEHLTYHPNEYTHVQCNVAKNGVVNLKYKCIRKSESYSRLFLPA